MTSLISTEHTRAQGVQRPAHARLSGLTFVRVLERREALAEEKNELTGRVIWAIGAASRNRRSGGCCARKVRVMIDAFDKLGREDGEKLEIVAAKEDKPGRHDRHDSKHEDRWPWQTAGREEQLSKYCALAESPVENIN